MLTVVDVFAILFPSFCSILFCFLFTFDLLYTCVIAYYLLSFFLVIFFNEWLISLFAKTYAQNLCYFSCFLFSLLFVFLAVLFPLPIATKPIHNIFFQSVFFVSVSPSLLFGIRLFFSWCSLLIFILLYVIITISWLISQMVFGSYLNSQIII